MVEQGRRRMSGVRCSCIHAKYVMKNGRPWARERQQSEQEQKEQEEERDEEGPTQNKEKPTI
jgi:hypothetical protein